MTYLGEFHCNKNRSKYLSLSAFFATFGGVIQSTCGLIFLTMDFTIPLFGGFVIFDPWRLHILVCSMLSGIAFTFMLFLPESPKFLLLLGKPEESIAVLKRVYLCNNKNSNEVYFGT